jgi:hypothetical protein
MIVAGRPVEVQPREEKGGEGGLCGRRNTCGEWLRIEIIVRRDQ